MKEGLIGQEITHCSTMDCFRRSGMYQKDCNKKVINIISFEEK